MTPTPEQKDALLRQMAEALETSEKMADSDLMFCVNGANEDFSHIPYEDVQEIARRVCRIIASRNESALDAYREAMVV